MRYFFLAWKLNKDCYRNIFVGQKIQKYFQNSWRKKIPNFSDTIFNIYIIKQVFSKNRINRCNCCGPDASFETKIGQINLCHLRHSTSNDFLCQMTRLDHRNCTHFSNLGLKQNSKCKYWKACQKHFSVINF